MFAKLNNPRLVEKPPLNVGWWLDVDVIQMNDDEDDDEDNDDAYYFIIIVKLSIH